MSVYAYRDLFDGTAGDDLSTHSPNVGGPYAPTDGVGPMLVMLLDGSGNLLPPVSDTGPDPASAIAGAVGDTYTVLVLFNPAILDAGSKAFIDIGVRIAATDTWLINPYLEWKTGAWTFGSYVQNAADSTLFSEDNDVTALVNTGVLNRLTVDVSPSGTIWKMNGTVVTSDANVPDAAPDSVALESFAHDPALSIILLDEVSLTGAVSDAQFQQWLERSGNYRCALFELTFLGAALGSPSASQEYHAFVSNMPYVTRATDSPAHQTFDNCVVDVPAFTRRMGEQLEGRSTQSYGDLLLSNESVLDRDGAVLQAGVRDDWLAMNWDGRRYRMWLGDPAWPFSDFRLVQDGIISDVFDPGGYKLGFKISDKAALLNRPIMTTLLGGTGPDAGNLMPLALGNVLTNIEPKLVDETTRAYRITAVDYAGIVERLREDVQIVVYENRNELQNLSHANITATDTATDLLHSVGNGLFVNSRVRVFDVGSGLPAPLVAGTDYWVIASGLTADDFKVSATQGGSAINLTSDPGGDVGMEARHWTMDYPNGGFTLAGNPSGESRITCTLWGLRVGGGFGVMDTASDIINQVLTSSLTNTPLTSADIDAASFAAFDALTAPDTQLSYYLTEKTTFAELFDKLVLSVGGWWGFSRNGLLQLGRLDLPDPMGTPVYSFIADDVARRSMKLLRRILPRAEVKLLADTNWTVQSVFAGVVSQYDRGLYSKPGTEYLGAPVITDWTSDPTSHRNAVFSEVFQTYISVGAQSEADRLATLFQNPTAIWTFDTSHVVYLLELGDLIYVEHPKFTGYGIVVGTVERIKGRSTVEFFAQLPDNYPTADIA